MSYEKTGNISMKVLCYFPGVIPAVASGAEYYNHQVIMKMIEWGWDVKVCTQRKCTSPHHPVYGFGDLHQLTGGGWPDILVSTHYHWRHCKAKCPTFIIQHSLNFQPFNFSDKRMIYCASHVRDSHQEYLQKQPIYRSIFSRHVFHPPVRLERRKEARKAASGYVTMVSVAREKGGAEFKMVNAMLPDVQFMGVMGHYGQQITFERPNVKYVANTSDIQSIYDQTSILVHMSRFEGLPTVILEAISQGIPVVTYPIPGAVEALGECGVYANDPKGIADAIVKVQGNYHHYSRLALARSQQMQPDWNGLKKYLLANSL